MKALKIKFIFSMVILLLSFIKPIVASEANGTIELCLSDKSATYQFSSPAYASVDVNDQTTFVTLDDFVRIGNGVMLVFTVNLDDPTSASKICINTTTTQHSSEHPIVNGIGHVQIYVPLTFTSTSRNKIYISLR